VKDSRSQQTRRIGSLASAPHRAAARATFDLDIAIDVRSWLLCSLAEPGRIPAGWRPIALSVRSKLATVTRDRRQRLLVNELPDADPFDTLAPLVAVDPVVAGVIRKANAQARIACRVCGAPRVRSQGGLYDGYCAKHSAVPYLQWLIESVALKAKAIRSTAPQPGGKQSRQRALRLPGPVVRTWLESVQATQAEVDALAPAHSALVELDDYDLPRFAAWLEGLRAGVEVEVVMLKGGV
jgi:hypothetical protein